jgi:hypothetical protein
MSNYIYLLADFKTLSRKIIGTRPFSYSEENAMTPSFLAGW